MGQEVVSDVALSPMPLCITFPYLFLSHAFVHPFRLVTLSGTHASTRDAVRESWHHSKKDEGRSLGTMEAMSCWSCPKTMCRSVSAASTFVALMPSDLAAGIEVRT